MILMHFLRALADLGLYYAFAGTIAGAMGGTMALAMLLAQSGCFALSAVLRKRRWARLAALLPAAAALLLPGMELADRTAALPGLAYLAYLVWQGKYELRWGRQADVFSLLWKAFAPFAPISALFGCHESIVSCGFPIFLTAAAGSILLLRSLRHGPEIYLQRPFQARNWLAVGLLLAGAYFASTDGFLTCLWLAYDRMLIPLLLGIAMAVGIVCMVAAQALWWGVNQLFKMGWEPSSAISAADSVLDQAREMVGAGEDFNGDILTALGVLAAALACVLLFRWLVRRKSGPAENAANLRGERRSIAEEPAPGRRELLPNTCAGRIRGQYRRFLKLCRKRGVELSPSDTSAQVSAKAARWMAEAETLAALEEIYCKARYGGQATREDLAEAKRLYGQVKKAAKHGAS